MKKIICSILILLIARFTTYGQDEYLQLSNKCKGTPSSFNKVNIIDNRLGNQTLGFVQVGPLNRMAQVKFAGNLADSLALFFTSANSTEETQPELVIILDELYLSEKTEAMSETGRLKIAMRLFSNTDQNKFKEFYAVDSIYTFKAVDVTKKLLRSVSDHLCDIKTRVIENKSLAKENLPLYSLNELTYLDSLEKQKIPIYSAPNANSGIYTDYEHFKTNSPDHAIISIDTSDSNNIKVYKWDQGKRKKTKLDNKTVYAVSDGNILLKATTIGFYRLKKINHDFYFVGQTSFSNSNNVAMWGAAFGLVGAAIAAEAERNTQLFRFKINYRRGNSIPISKAIH